MHESAMEQAQVSRQQDLAALADQRSAAGDLLQQSHRYTTGPMRLSESALPQCLRICSPTLLCEQDRKLRQSQACRDDADELASVAKLHSVCDTADRLLTTSASCLAAYLGSKHPRLSRLRQLCVTLSADVRAAGEAHAAFQGHATQCLTHSMATAECACSP